MSWKSDWVGSMSGGTSYHWTRDSPNSSNRNNGVTTKEKRRIGDGKGPFGKWKNKHFDNNPNWVSNRDMFDKPWFSRDSAIRDSYMDTTPDDVRYKSKQDEWRIARDTSIGLATDWAIPWGRLGRWAGKTKGRAAGRWIKREGRWLYIFDNQPRNVSRSVQRANRMWNEPNLSAAQMRRWRKNPWFKPYKRGSERSLWADELFGRQGWEG